jgi:hypothetical protein
MPGFSSATGGFVVASAQTVPLQENNGSDRSRSLQSAELQTSAGNKAERMRIEAFTAIAYIIVSTMIWLATVTCYVRWTKDNVECTDDSHAADAFEKADCGSHTLDEEQRSVDFDAVMVSFDPKVKDWQGKDLEALQDWQGKDLEALQDLQAKELEALQAAKLAEWDDLVPSIEGIPARILFIFTAFDRK